MFIFLKKFFLKIGFYSWVYVLIFFRQRRYVVGSERKEFRLLIIDKRLHNRKLNASVACLAMATI